MAEPHRLTREVYLPAGANWTNAWSGTSHNGGTTLSVDAPLDRIPVFFKEGSPLAPLFNGGGTLRIAPLGQRDDKAAAGRIRAVLNKTVSLTGARDLFHQDGRRYAVQ